MVVSARLMASSDPSLAACARIWRVFERRITRSTWSQRFSPPCCASDIGVVPEQAEKCTREPWEASVRNPTNDYGSGWGRELAILQRGHVACVRLGAAAGRAGRRQGDRGALACQPCVGV